MTKEYKTAKNNYLYLELTRYELDGGDVLVFEEFPDKGDHPGHEFCGEYITYGYFPFYSLETAIESLKKVIEIMNDEYLDFELTEDQLQNLIKQLEDKNHGEQLFENFVNNYNFLIENDLLEECLAHSPRHSGNELGLFKDYNELGMFDDGDPLDFFEQFEDFKVRVKEYLELTNKDFPKDKLLRIFTNMSEESIQKEKLREAKLTLKEKQEELIELQRDIEETKKLIEELEKNQ